MHCRYFEVNAIKNFFNRIYKKASNDFSSRNVTVDSSVFCERLGSLIIFLRKTKTGTETDRWALERIRENIRYINGEIKIDSLTHRIFDDFRNPIYSKSLVTFEVKKVLYGFCQQWNIEKQELLFLVEQCA